MKRKIFAVAAFFICSQLAAQQQDSLLSEKENPNWLEKVVITANKYPRKQAETGKVVTVIDKTMLERMGGARPGRDPQHGNRYHHQRSEW